MKKAFSLVVALGVFASALGCAGMSLQRPDPKRMACESAADKVQTEAVKTCNDKAGSNSAAAALCDEAGKQAYKKSFDECMAK